MGKRIRVQRRGRGGSQFVASTHKRVGAAQYPVMTPKETSESLLSGTIESLVHDPGRGSPLALVRFENGEKSYLVSPEGTHEGQKNGLGYHSLPRRG